MGNRPLVAHELAAAAGENRPTPIKRARHYWLLLAESHFTRLLGQMLRGIWAMPMPSR